MQFIERRMNMDANQEESESFLRGVLISGATNPVRRTSRSTNPAQGPVQVVAAAGLGSSQQLATPPSDASPVDAVEVFTCPSHFAPAHVCDYLAYPGFRPPLLSQGMSMH